MGSRARAGNLTAALVFVSFLELVLNRLASRLFLPQSISNGSSSLLGRAIADSGPFLFHLTGILALLILLPAMVGLLRRQELFPRPVRVTVSIIGAAFWLLAALGVVVGQIPRNFFLHLETSFGFVSLLAAAAFLGTPTQRRTKVGVLLLALPGPLHALAIVLERTPWLRDSAAPIALARWGEALLLSGAALAPLTLVPRRFADRRWLLPVSVAGSVTAIFAVALLERYDLVQATALYGLHLEVPHLLSPMGLAYLVATFGWALAVVQLLRERGGTRLAGYGLLMLAIAGYQVGSPVELSVSLIGLLAVCVGELRAAPARGGVLGLLGRTEWRSHVGELATAAGDGTAPNGSSPPEAMVVDQDDLEVSHVRGHRRRHPFDLRLLRRRGRVVEFEITVGDPGHREPSATVERHRSWLARSPGDRVALPRMRTGDPSFDQKFSVHGGAPLASADIRRQVMRQGYGVLSLWQGLAARYRAVGSGASAEASPPDDSVDPPFSPNFGHASEGREAVVAMLDTLIDLVESEKRAQGAG